MRHAWFLALLLSPLAMPALAGTGYKCVDARGHVSFQDTPCARGERQTVLHLPTAVDAARQDAPVEAPSAAVPMPPPRPSAPAFTRVPPPILYRCTPATGGDTYLSRTGVPPPYLVPFSMLGSLSVPLATEYGAAQGANVGMSAPELMSRPTPAMIGSQYVRVRDVCESLPPAAACEALAKLDDANDEALRHAFRDERAPLLARRARLQAQMAGCQS